MSNCQTIRDLIPLFPNDLEPDEAAAVGAHAAACEACAAELRAYVAQAGRFDRYRAARTPAKVDLWAGIQEELARPEPALIAFPFSRGRVAAAAALLLGLGLLAWTRAPRPEAVEHMAGVTPVTPKAPGTSQDVAAKPERRAATRRIYQLEGSTPMIPADNVEYFVDEEAEAPAPRAHAEPPAHPSPRGASDDDRSLSF